MAIIRVLFLFIWGVTVTAEVNLFHVSYRPVCVAQLSYAATDSIVLYTTSVKLSRANMQIYGGFWLALCFNLLKGKTLDFWMDSFLLRYMNLFDASSALHFLIQKVNNRVWLTISKPKNPPTRWNLKKQASSRGPHFHKQSYYMVFSW